jgi:hypothetical protein
MSAADMPAPIKAAAAIPAATRIKVCRWDTRRRRGASSPANRSVKRADSAAGNGRGASIPAISAITSSSVSSLALSSAGVRDRASASRSAVAGGMGRGAASLSEAIWACNSASSR